MADRVVLMHDGRIEQAGTPGELYHRPRTRFVAGFVGRMNMLPATVLAGDRVRVRDSELQCAPGTLQVGTQATVGIRPEQVVVRRFGDSLGANSFAARLLDTEFLGHRTAARLACEPLGIEIEAELPADHRVGEALVPSSMVHIELPQHALSVLAH